MIYKFTRDRKTSHILLLPFAEQERKIREKAAKRRSYHSVDGVSQKSSQASSGNLYFEENYF